MASRSMMMCHSLQDTLCRFDSKIRLFLGVSLIHPRRETVLGEFCREGAANFRLLVDIVDLIAAGALRDPGFRHALRVADGDPLVLEGEIARRRRAGIEVLVKPH